MLHTKKNGMTLLISVLVMGAAAIVIGASMAIHGIEEVDVGRSTVQTTETLAVTDACAEEALLQLKRRGSAYTGATIAIGDGVCTVKVTGTYPHMYVHATGSILRWTRELYSHIVLSGSSMQPELWSHDPWPPENCTNGIDDDGDTFIDCADIADCTPGNACQNSGVCYSGTCCGDGTVDAGEECNEPALTCGFGLTCDTPSCRCLSCIPTETPNETTCNDSTDNDCDADIDCADADCTAQTCQSAGICYAGTCCGDGLKEGSEQCDDDNITNGDGCSSSCQNEAPCNNDDVCDLLSSETSSNCALDCEVCDNSIDDADVDSLIDCADVIDCPNGTTCDTGKTCQSGSCLSDTPPTITSHFPLDDATDVYIGTNLTITFSETIFPQSGASNDIAIYETMGDILVETIDAEDARVTGGGTSTITIDLLTTLSEPVEYYVLIGADAFDDSTGNSFAGISSTTSWSFTTGVLVCNVCAQSASSWTFTIALTSSSCTGGDCNTFNGPNTLDFANETSVSCDYLENDWCWETWDSASCGAAGPMWDLWFDEVEDRWELSAATMALYTHPNDISWNCTGNNVLTLDSSDPECTDWPPSITITYNGPAISCSGG